MRKEALSSPRLRPIAALLPVLLALAVQALLWDAVIRPYAWFLFFPALFASSWIGGRRAGLQATALSAALVWWFFIPPEHRLVKDARQLFPAAIFIGMGIALSLFQDALRRAKDEITQLYQQTVELDELKSRFFANVSHELRTPLTLILGPTERLLAADAPKLSTHVRRTLELVDRNARVLLGHVNDLMDVSKLDAGKLRPHYAELDLAELVRLVRSHYDSLAAERDIAFSVRANSPLIVQADIDLLQRVLMNLLGNAVKFTPDGGVIRVQLSSDPDSGCVVLEVADSGPGVAAEHRDAIFERFVQIEAGRTRRFGGTGLGLSITRELVLLHGGRVSVGDAPEGGAVFRVELPLRAPADVRVGALPPEAVAHAAQALAGAPRPARTAPEEAPAGAASGGLVLVVEDDRDLSGFICEILATDHRVATAFDGADGLAQARRLRPDVVLCDMMMPELGGEDLLSAVRADPELQDIPILVLTAKADEELRVRLLRAGAADYVTKPFSVAELRARVDNLVAYALAGETLRASEAAAQHLAVTRLEAEASMWALLDSAPDAMVVVDRDGIIRLINHRTEALFGYDRSELLGAPVEVLLPDAGRSAHIGLRTGYFRAPHTRAMGASLDLSGRRKDGTHVPIEVSLSPFEIADGILVTAAIRDITDRRALEDRLRLHGERFRVTFHDAPIGMAITDLHAPGPAAWADVNQALVQTLGYPREELLAMDPEDLIHPDDRGGPDDAPATGGDLHHHTTERRFRHADGHHIWMRVSESVILDPEGEPELAISHMEDITARRQATDELAHAALHDALTGLPNRTLLLDRLTQHLIGLKRSTRLVALIYIDLDRFKHVNDTLGHAAGDELLIEVARRLTTVVRPTDTAARLSGDEFVIVCHDLHDERDALTLAERVVHGLDAPFVLDGHTTEVGASVGMAITRDPGHAPEVLLREADAAMYRAKRRGGGRVELFDEALAERVRQDAEIEQILRDGLAHGDLRLHYQPIVDLTDGRITAVEALLRIHHPSRGLIGPDQFLDVAESTGLIVPIGRWALGEACRQLAAWNQVPAAPLTMAVNISARQILHGDLGAVVIAALEEQHLDPHQLRLEITESIFADTSPPVLETLTMLKARGVALALDDFGTGYSSLAYLKRFAVDQLKIDRHFTAGLDTHRNDTAIIDAITSLGRSLELTVVAEGVETDTQLQALLRLGCHFAQGHLFAAAADAESITLLLDAATALPTVGLRQSAIAVTPREAS